MTFRPLHDKVIVKQRDAEKVSDGGIVIAGTPDKPFKGDVLAVGPGRYLDTGEQIPLTVSVGDVVIFGQRSGEELEVENETILCLRESEILAVIDE